MKKSRVWQKLSMDSRAHEQSEPWEAGTAPQHIAPVSAKKPQQRREMKTLVKRHA